MRSFLVPEPDLIFRDKTTCADPRVGLLNYKPNGLEHNNLRIPIGIIGSKKSINAAIDFLSLLQYSIEGVTYPNSNIRNLDFPGLYQDGPLGFYMEKDDNYCQEISSQNIEKILNIANRNERIVEFSEHIKQILKDLSGQNLPRPVIIITIPKKILEACSDPFTKDKKIRLSDRNFRDLQRIASMDQSERPIFYDFHNYIKVLGYELNLRTQLMLPQTLEFKGGNLEDPASIAWNYVVAQYYKFSGIPWKLADLNPETVHVGISFYYDINKRDSVVIKAAIAQVYMRTGDSQVARGLELKVEHEEDIRRTNLTEEQAKDILSQAINLYKRQHHNSKPNRIVVHKKSEYTEEENEGFLKSTKNIEIQDFIHIKEYCHFNAITSTDYPIARGSVFERNSNNKKVFNLYTTGYIPCLDTYPGSMIPKPIEVIVEKSDSDTEILARDIINLTKLDWNSTDFCKRMPVTLSVSKKVGKIMGELKGRDITPPTAYSNYM
ncbi:MAG: hypothetical protein CEE43_01790 [Promethearchaeota archaeon Loki_b32]|nr:MAG: hypothetical protein CEE43_01790 [Candidatus Lokiarchaeota archaeon Loki_b32]